MRAALLTSISHDLRTPLASILGTVSSLRSYADRYDASDRDELLATLRKRGRASEPLRRQPARYDAPGIRRDRVEARPCRSGRNRRRGIGARRQCPSAAPDGSRASTPICRCCGSTRSCSSRSCSTCSTTPPNTRRTAAASTLRARQDGDAVAIEIIDEGPGIPPADLERVFDKFYRVQAQDRRRAGTGLGSGDLPRVRRGARRPHRARGIGATGRARS